MRAYLNGACNIAWGSSVVGIAEGQRVEQDWY